MSSCTRRQFLARSVRGGAAALLASGLSGALRAMPLGGPAGIQLYAVKDSLQADPAATLRRIRDIGFGEVETAGFAGLAAKDFRKLLDDTGLASPSAHLQFDLGNLNASFDDAHALGARYAASGSLRALAGGSRGGMGLEEAQRTAEIANRIGEQARRAGLRYVYHNHDFEFADQGGKIGYDLLLERTDPELVRFEIDCGWMVVGGRDPIDYFRRHPHRFPMIHVKDFLPTGASGAPGAAAAHAGAELGHGIIDYRPIFAAAEKQGLEHYFAEQEGPFTRMSELEAARQAYAYISRIP